jgi:hypothetical protein
MIFNNVDEAIRVLGRTGGGSLVHQEAIHFLAGLEGCAECEALVRALQNDDFSVRWQASLMLAWMGWKAVPAILSALIDPQRVGDQRLRQSVIHTIHSFQEQAIRSQFAPLLKALSGLAADLATMREASLLYAKICPTGQVTQPGMSF